MPSDHEQPAPEGWGEPLPDETSLDVWRREADHVTVVFGRSGLKITELARRARVDRSVVANVVERREWQAMPERAMARRVADALYEHTGDHPTATVAELYGSNGAVRRATDAREPLRRAWTTRDDHADFWVSCAPSGHRYWDELRAHIRRELRCPDDTPTVAPAAASDLHSAAAAAVAPPLPPPATHRRRRRTIVALTASVLVIAIVAVLAATFAFKSRAPGKLAASHCSAPTVAVEPPIGPLADPTKYIPGWKPVPYDTTPVCTTVAAIAQEDHNCRLDDANAAAYEAILLNLGNDTWQQVAAVGELVADDSTSGGTPSDAGLQGPLADRDALNQATRDWRTAGSDIVQAAYDLRDGHVDEAVTQVTASLGPLGEAQDIMVKLGAPNCADATPPDGGSSSS